MVHDWKQHFFWQDPRSWALLGHEHLAGLDHGGETYCIICDEIVAPAKPVERLDEQQTLDGYAC